MRRKRKKRKTLGLHWSLFSKYLRRFHPHLGREEVVVAEEEEAGKGVPRQMVS